MSRTFDYLRDRIEENFWLGKEILSISDEIRQFLNAPREWFLELPPIRFIREITDPIFEPIRNVIDSIQDNVDVVASTALLTLETIYGINKAFNSETYSTVDALESKGNGQLNEAKFTDSEYYLYIRSIDAYNVGLNLPQLSQRLAEMEEQITQIEEMGENAIQKMREEEARAFQKLHETKAEMEQALETATGAVRRRVQRILRRVTKLIEELQQPSEPEENRPAIILAPIAAVATPTVVTVTTVVTQIASFLLSGFLLKALAQQLNSAVAIALSQSAGSVVCKFFGSTGANGLRYLAAATLKNNISLLPKIFSTTAMKGFAWVFLTAYAPYIIVASILIILAIKKQRDREVTATHFYVFADHDELPGFAYANILNSDQVQTELSRMRDDLLNIAQTTYPQVIGIGIEDNEIAVGYNLSSGNAIQMPKSEAQRLYDEFVNKHNIGTPSGEWRPV